MSFAKSRENVFDDYEYLQENSIDGELKCSLCMSPFQSPVSGECGHTFCAECLNPWLVRQSTCPTCRLPTPSESFRPISTRIVLNQLDRLLLRCRRCNQSNIQRSDVNEHQKRCPNQTVSCLAFDIKCPWKGTRSALTTHLEECPFQKIRPAINDLYEHLKNVYEPLVEELQSIRENLQMQLIQMQQQNRFLLAVFNRGKPMNERCSGQQRQCLLRVKSFAPRGQGAENQWGRDSPTSDFVNCSNCQTGVQPSDVALHHCEGGVICRLCLENYANLDAPRTKVPDS